MSSPPEPQVSIVTTLLRADPDQFAAAARSVAAQTFRAFEWVVHECPPHGRAGEILAGLDLPHVRHERAPAPVSLAAGRNAAIALARGGLLAILDGDDECAPDRLERQVGFLAQAPEVDVLGSAVEVVDDAGERLGYRSYPATQAEVARTVRRQNPIAHPAAMLRREALAAVGGYRDYGEGTCDDYELWSRMLRAGARFANLPDVLLRYRVHAAATKAQRLRATLRDTLRVKADYWRQDFTLGDRLRALGERALLRLPPRLVLRWFLRRTLRPAPAGGAAP